MTLVLATASAVFVAGDSRQSVTLDDTIQKVFLVGNDALIAHAGVGVIPDAGPQGEPWDAAAELRTIAAETTAGSFAHQLREITEKLETSFANALSRFDEIIRTDPPAKIDIFFAKRNADGRVSVALQEFYVRSLQKADVKWQHRLELGELQIMLNDTKLADDAIRTYWSVPPGCAVNSSSAPPIPRENIASWIRDLIRSVANQSPQCTAQIGGPIRIATVDSEGARWLAEN